MAIKCNKCDRMNPDNAIYCGSCGVKLDVSNKEDLSSEMEEHVFHEQEYVIPKKSKLDIIKSFLGENWFLIFWIVLGSFYIFMAFFSLSFSIGQACLHFFQGVVMVCSGIIFMSNKLEKYINKCIEKSIVFSILFIGIIILFLVSFVVLFFIY